MSHSTTPTLPWVLPMYEHMDRHLKKQIDDVNQLPLLRVAAIAGMQKLHQYHAKARDCQYNVIATCAYHSIIFAPLLIIFSAVLHPYLGISWFRRVDTTGEHARKATDLLEHAFKNYQAAEPTPKPVTRKLTSSSSFSSFIDDVSMADGEGEVPAVPAISELERFLQAHTTFGRGDPNAPLLWWKVSW